MDKQTFYSELTSRLKNLGIPDDFISRNIAQFDAHFRGKSDEQIKAEIAKLGDLDKVAMRIKKMTDKVIEEARLEQESNDANVVTEKPEIQAQQHVKAEPASNNNEDRQEYTSNRRNQDEDELIEYAPQEEQVHIRSEKLANERRNSIKNAPIDPEVLSKNRKKFWLLFILTLPLTAITLAIIGSAFALTFFAIAVVILISVGVLVLITALGTVASIIGLIFGVSQMMSSLPIGLYECGIAICIGSIALFLGILVYNFAVRLMPFCAKELLIFIIKTP
jgi:uncharacterized membrane protein